MIYCRFIVLDFFTVYINNILYCMHYFQRLFKTSFMFIKAAVDKKYSKTAIFLDVI